MSEGNGGDTSEVPTPAPAPAGRPGAGRLWLDPQWKRRGLATAVTVAGLVGADATSRGHALDLQLGSVSWQGASWVPGHLAWDVVFIAGYMWLFWLLLDWRWSSRTDAYRYRGLVLILPFALAAADLGENALILACRWWPGHPDMVTALHVVSRTKWFLAGGTVIAIVWQFRRQAPRGRQPLPFGRKRARAWRRASTLPKDWARGGRGICLSGGGIRSAAFGMGGLHGLGPVVVRNANYLAAASGGAYTAAAMTIHQKNAPGSLPFAEGSGELRRLRARSSYLFLHGRDGRFAIGRALGAMVVNFLILFAAMFVVARPLGWAMGYVHHELRAPAPIIHDLRVVGADRALTVVELATTDPGGACGLGGERAQYWSVEFARPGVVLYQERASTSTAGSVSFIQIPETTAGVVRTCGARLELIRQPTIAPASPVVLEGSPEVTVSSASSSIPPTVATVSRALKVDRVPAYGHERHAEDRPDLQVEAWMWVGLAVLVLCTLAVFALPLGLLRGDADATTRQGWLHTAAPVVTAAWGVFLILGPWLLLEFSRLTAGLPGGGASTGGGTFVAWLVAAVASGGLARTAVGSLAKGAGTVLKRAGRLGVKATAYLLLILTGLVVGVFIANGAAMVGPGGRSDGSSLSGGWLPLPTDLARWGAVVVVLLVTKELLAAHSWSLNPLYRDRLSAAFLRTAEHDEAQGRRPKPFTSQLPSDIMVPSPPPGPGETLVTERRWPELLVCCTANIVDPVAELPAKRWSDSFVFSSTHLGSPSLGYLPTADYLGRLSRRRQRDLSIESIVAVSGAAFSPAMGKQDVGPIGGLFAMLDLRLGLWLPNPLSVAEASSTWDANPGWPWLLREVFGRYSTGDPFVYTTDGGHWENLGLVELLRHGCNEVIVLSAAGDGIDFFPTLGDAIALAREQVRLEIHLDPSELRALRSGPLTSADRELLRQQGGVPAAVPFADKPYAVGWFQRDPADPSTRGRILFVEATLTKDLPFDVHAFAESHPIFPDHPTGNQFYNHRTFEAYRALGEFQARTAAASPEWEAARQWVEAADPNQPAPILTPPAPPAVAPQRVAFDSPLEVRLRPRRWRLR